MSNFSRVGDCFDPVVDPAFDCNPFWIAIRKVRIAILKKDRDRLFLDCDRQSRLRPGLYHFLREYPLFVYLHLNYLILILNKRLSVNLPKNRTEKSIFDFFDLLGS